MLVLHFCSTAGFKSPDEFSWRKSESYFIFNSKGTWLKNLFLRDYSLSHVQMFKLQSIGAFSQFLCKNGAVAVSFCLPFLFFLNHSNLLLQSATSLTEHDWKWFCSLLYLSTAEVLPLQQMQPHHGKSGWSAKSQGGVVQRGEWHVAFQSWTWIINLVLVMANLISWQSNESGYRVGANWTVAAFHLWRDQLLFHTSTFYFWWLWQK